MPPDAKTFENGTKITLAEVGVGDRVYAGGRYEAETKSVAARLLVVMSKSDIERRRASERAEWQRRGLAGTVSAVDVQKQEISVQVRSREGAKSMTLGVGPDTIFRRYVPDTVKFSEARPSSLADLKAGDQLRALVKQGGEGVRPFCEEVVSGEFLTVGGTVTAVDASKGEIKINLLNTQKPLTINLKPETLPRRVGPDVLAALGAAMPQPAAQPQQGAPAAPGAKGVDLQEMLDRLSPLRVRTGRAGPDDSRLKHEGRGPEPRHGHHGHRRPRPAARTAGAAARSHPAEPEHGASLGRARHRHRPPVKTWRA